MINQPVSDAEGIIQNIDGALNQMAAMPRDVAARQIMLSHAKQMAGMLATNPSLPPEAVNAAKTIAEVSDAETTPNVRIPDVAPGYTAATRPGQKTGKPFNPKNTL